MRALGARSATADRPTDLVVGDDQQRAPPPPPLLEEHTNAHGTRGGRTGKRALAFRLRLAVCLSASENGAAAGLGALPLGVVFCCGGGLLVLVFNKPCASPALALH